MREERPRHPGSAYHPGELVPAEVAAEVVERYRAGETAPALARAYGLKQCRVYKLLHEATLSSGSGVMRSQSEALKLEQARRLAERRER